MRFDEYYENYLTLHQNSINRKMHVVGNCITIAFILFCVFNKNYLFLFLSPFVVYPFAWSGHLFFEKNNPAAWSNPFYAKLSDWKMMYDMIRGHIKW